MRALLDRGCEVRVLDNLSTGRSRNLTGLEDRIDFRNGSVADEQTASSAVEGCEAVFHQAAIPSVARSVAEPLATNHVNVTGTLNMLVAAQKANVRKFMFAASSSAYGDNAELPKREEMQPLPKSPYAVAKLTGELYCKVFGQLYDMETIALRYFNVFGPRQDPTSRYAAVVPKFISMSLADMPLTVDGDGAQSRDFTFVENVVQANMLALDARGVTAEVFNIGCGERFDLIRLIDEIGRIAGKQPEVTHLPPRAGDVPHSLADISKARRLLGYEPAVTFQDGLRRTYEWLESHPEERFAG